MDEDLLYMTIDFIVDTTRYILASIGVDRYNVDNKKSKSTKIFFFYLIYLNKKLKKIECF